MESDVLMITVEDKGRGFEIAAVKNSEISVCRDSMESKPPKGYLQIIRKIKVIALSMHVEKICVNGMINAGVSGYILKSCSFKELLDCIASVLADAYCFCQEIIHMVNHNDKNRVEDKDDSIFSILSKREREVLQLIAEGYKSRKIADKLNISIKTVDIHRTHLKKKLNIHTIAELTKFDISERITSASL